MNSGLFNTSFSLGNIIGPLVGNFGYINFGFEWTCEYLGYILILYAIIYFFVCDDLFFKGKRAEDDLNVKLLE